MMRNFQLIALLLTSFVTPNLVYAVNDHEHDSKTAKHHEHKQNEDEKSRENGAKIIVKINVNKTTGIMITVMINMIIVMSTNINNAALNL